MANQNQNMMIRNSGRDNYGFLSYKATAVGYNVLLQGQFRDSAHTFSGDEIERLVHWAALGWTYEFSERSKLMYSFNVRSAEFKGPMAREHYWGGLYYTRSTGK
jgi:hypothetical protein